MNRIAHANPLWRMWLPAALAACGLCLPVAAADPQKVRDVTFDDLKFDIEKDAPFERPMLTESIEDLAGKPIRIRGYILPSFQQKGITQFVLVRDNMECCFGPGAALFDCIVVQMEPGKSVSYTIRPVAVEGVFSINEVKGPGDRHLAVFALKGRRVE